MTTTIKPEDMPAPETLVSYANGSVMAAMFHYAAEGDDLREISRENGLACLIAPLLDAGLMQRYEGGENILSKWRPDPPAGWMFGGVYDTEDGPCAIFLRSAEARSEAAE